VKFSFFVVDKIKFKNHTRPHLLMVLEHDLVKPSVDSAIPSIKPVFEFPSGSINHQLWVSRYPNIYTFCVELTYETQKLKKITTFPEAIFYSYQKNSLF